jgi:single-strand DNA-binding protein
MSVNKVILLGNIGADPEIRYTNNGDAVVTLSIATSEVYKDKQSGERKQITEWHKVIFYRDLAEIVGKYLKKGDQIYIEGKIKTRKWTDQQSVERYTTEIFATEMRMLGKRAQEGGQGSIGQSNQDYSRESISYDKSYDSKPNNNSNFIEDDIPF